MLKVSESPSSGLRETKELMDGLEFLSPSLTKTPSTALDIYENLQLPPLDLGTNFRASRRERSLSFELLPIEYTVSSSIPFTDIRSPLEDAMSSIRNIVTTQDVNGHISSSPVLKALNSSSSSSSSSCSDGMDSKFAINPTEGAHSSSTTLTINAKSPPCCTSSSILSSMPSLSKTKLKKAATPKTMTMKKVSTKSPKAAVKTFKTPAALSILKKDNIKIEIPEIENVNTGPVLDGSMKGEKTKKIGIYSPESRRKRILRFMEKRKRRVFHKQIKYDCRKRLAAICPRVKGRFVKRSVLTAAMATAALAAGTVEETANNAKCDPSAGFGSKAVSTPASQSVSSSTLPEKSKSMNPTVQPLNRPPAVDDKVKRLNLFANVRKTTSLAVPARKDKRKLRKDPFEQRTLSFSEA